jgi:two-component system cell cycle sensor histidine kinase/response regulator CckA
MMINLDHKNLVGKETILFVEEYAALRDLISMTLREYGFTVLTAAHEDEAQLICEGQKEPIHLILIDAVRPQLGGNALAERLVQIHPEMKVLYMSGYPEQAIVSQGVLYSEANFISKPFKLLSLVRKVRRVLDSSQQGKRPHKL